MKKLMTFVLTVASALSMVACNTQIAEPVNAIEGNMKTYYELSDGTWQFDEHVYKYRLEIVGRMPNAVKDTTYVYLSNIEDISFHKAMMASGLSSHLEDYFSDEEAILVEIN